ncbi:MAG: NAD(P)H-dependent oxidoreductase subunit E [Xanthomonadales bacterium]|nr:hypothetical protein [Xanthomonadales bacterium]MCC6593252.1 NAD(P)H-dependent oxidoreductase subunit E [Xanthomonadales bacterium]MCE7929871.1 NADH-quinone oxidoreductase subunit E [Xanthomonadales bacterium PRO6]
MADTPEFDVRVADALIAAEIAAARDFYGEDANGATALLPILHALQARFGCVPAEAVPLVAEGLNVSRADVRGVLSFYHDFREAPAARHVLKLCRAEACQARGCERVAAHLASAHGLRPGQTRDELTLENVYCLGNCTLGPAALLDERLLANLDESAVDALILGLKESGS